MKKSKLIEIVGDITNPQNLAPNEIVLIPHCCNNKGKMGAGVALSLLKKWPAVYETYKNFCEGKPPYLTNNKPLLGKVCYAKINNHLVIANMIGQDGTVSKDNPKPIKYKDLANCMTKVAEYIKMIRVQTSNSVVIHSPKFGSKLAGGRWDFVLELIREIWIEAGIDVVIYEYGR